MSLRNVLRREPIGLAALALPFVIVFLESTFLYEKFRNKVTVTATHAERKRPYRLSPSPTTGGQSYNQSGKGH